MGACAPLSKHFLDFGGSQTEGGANANEGKGRRGIPEAGSMYGGGGKSQKLAGNGAPARKGTKVNRRQQEGTEKVRLENNNGTSLDCQ